MTDTASVEAPKTMLERDRVCRVPCLAPQEMPLVGVDGMAVCADQHATLRELGSEAIADAFGRPHPPRPRPAVAEEVPAAGLGPGPARPQRTVLRRATAAALGVPVAGQGRAEQAARRRQSRCARSSNAPSLRFKC